MIRVEQVDDIFRVLEWDDGEDPEEDAVCIDEMATTEELLEAAADQFRRASELLAAVDVVLGIRRCRVCGCTDDDCSGCIERTGSPCAWVVGQKTEKGPICSACFLPRAGS